MKDQDINAINDFKTDKHLYLAVVGKGANQHLEAKKVSCLGRIFMYLGCHKASMKNVIAYLGDHLDEPLPVNLRNKIFEKIDKYVSHHKKFKIDDKITQFLKNVPPSNTLDEDGYKTLGLSTSTLLHDALKGITFKAWQEDKKIVKTKGPAIIDDKKYQEIDALIEERVKLLDTELDFSKVLKDRKLEEQFNLHQIMQPLADSALSVLTLSDEEVKSISVLKIPTLSVTEKAELERSFARVDLKDSVVKKELNFLALKDLTKLEKILTSIDSLTKLLDDATITKIIADKGFTQGLFNLIFNVNVGKLALITKGNVNHVAIFMDQEHFAELSQEATDAINFDSIKNFKVLNFDAFNEVNPEAIKNLSKDELNEALKKFPTSKAFLRIDEKQIKEIDPKAVSSLDAIFGDTPDEVRFHALTGAQVNGLFPLLTDKYYGILSKAQIKDLDAKLLIQSTFDKVFAEKGPISLLSADQIKVLAKFMKVEDFKEVDVDVDFARLKDFSKESFENYFLAWPGEIKSLSKADVNEALKLFPNVKAYSHLSEGQIKDLDSKLMGSSIDGIFGDTPDAARFQALSGAQVNGIITQLQDKHFALLSEAQIKALDANLLNQATFDKVFAKKDRLKWLSEDQVKVLAKFMKEAEFKEIEDVDVSFDTLKTLPKENFEGFFLAWPDAVQSLTKVELNEALKLYPDAKIYSDISDEQIGFIDGKITAAPFNLIFGDVAGKRAVRIQHLANQQVVELLHLFLDWHLASLTEAHIKGIVWLDNTTNDKMLKNDPEANKIRDEAKLRSMPVVFVEDKKFAPLFTNQPARIQLLHEIQVKALKTELSKPENVKHLDKSQLPWI